MLQLRPLPLRPSPDAAVYVDAERVARAWRRASTRLACAAACAGLCLGALVGSLLAR